jgi:hypothetical protein
MTMRSRRDSWHVSTRGAVDLHATCVVVRAANRQGTHTHTSHTCRKLVAVAASEWPKWPFDQHCRQHPTPTRASFICRTHRLFHVDDSLSPHEWAVCVCVCVCVRGGGHSPVRRIHMTSVSPASLLHLSSSIYPVSRVTGTHPLTCVARMHTHTHTHRDIQQRCTSTTAGSCAWAAWDQHCRVLQGLQ